MKKAFGLCGVRAFSLIEVLVAMVILAVLSLVLIQIITGVEQGGKLATRRFDAVEQAAFGAENLRRDIRGMIIRADLAAASPSDLAAGEIIRFLSTLEGPGGERGVSVISYRMGESPDLGGRRILQRSIRALNWADTGIFGVKADGSPARPLEWPVPIQPQANEYDDLGDGILRVSLVYQLRSAVGVHAKGALLAAPPLGVDGFPSWRSVGTIYLTTVSCDSRVARLLTPEQSQELASGFPEPTPQDLDAGKLPISIWEPLASDAARWMGIAPAAAASLRVYSWAIELPKS